MVGPLRSETRPQEPGKNRQVSALRQLGVHSEDTTMIGDRMDTDMVAGIESGMKTILVLTGVTRQEDIGRFPYLPSRVVQSVAAIEP